MDNFILLYSVRYITQPTRMRSKSFKTEESAINYYNACRADWYDKALKEYEKTVNNEHFRPSFEEYFCERIKPTDDVLREFCGEIGWTRFDFSLERI